MSATTALICMSFLSCACMAYGVDKYSLSYSYFDEIAQSYCAASYKGWIFAIRRDCGGVAPSCNGICKNASREILTRINHQSTRVACYDGFHILKTHPRLTANPSHAQPDAGVFNMGTYGYGKGACTGLPTIVDQITVAAGLTSIERPLGHMKSIMYCQ